MVEGIDECKIEFDKKKLDIDCMRQATKGLECYVLQVGVLDNSAPQNLEWQINQHKELMTAPPRMNALRLEQ